MTREPIYGVAPGQAYDATLDLLMPDDEDDTTAKRPAVQKAGEEKEC